MFGLHFGNLHQGNQHDIKPAIIPDEDYQSVIKTLNNLKLFLKLVKKFD